MNCPTCNSYVPEGNGFCAVCGTNVAAQPIMAQPAMAGKTTATGKDFDFSGNGAVAAAGTRKRYEYKILSQKDKWFSGKFDPALLEQAINAYAQQGWRVVGCATADIPGFGATRQEFVTVLEREV